MSTIVGGGGGRENIGVMSKIWLARPIGFFLNVYGTEFIVGVV